MKQESSPILPKLAKILAEMGENIKLARLRRKLSAQQVAERAGISRNSVWQIEKGSPAVAMGSYLQVLFVLGLEQDIALLAKDDKLGRKLEDARMLTMKRAPRRNQKPTEE